MQPSCRTRGKSYSYFLFHNNTAKIYFCNLHFSYSMNPYEKKRRWKFFLLFFAIIIGAASVFYSDFFVKKMEREEQLQLQLYVKVTEQSLVMYDDDRYTSLIELIRTNTKLPVIMTDSTKMEILSFQ